MIIGKPAPFVRAFVDAVDEAIRAQSPSHGMSAMQRTWLAFCVTAVLVTNSMCWARFERASLGTYALAALSWMFRHSKMPWDELLVARVRVILRHYGITSGSLVIDDTDNPRSKAAKALAHLYKLRDKESGGYLWGQSLVFLLLVTPTIAIPVGFAFYQPAPEFSAWYKKAKALKKQGVAKPQRPPQPPANPASPTKQQLALRLLERFHAHHPTFRVHCIIADALYGTAPFVDGASVTFGGVQVISQIRSNQKVRVHKRAQHVADYCATPPGTPHTIRIRGGEEVIAIVGSARVYVGSHKTKRFVVALKYEGEETSRSLIASDLSWRTLDIVQGQTLRWLVELLLKEWKSYANLHAFDTAKPVIVEGLIWIAIAAAALKRFLAHMTQLLTAVPMSTRKVAMCAMHVLGDVVEALKSGDEARLYAALEAAIMYLSCHAQRAHPERDRRTGRSQLGLEPCFENDDVIEFAEAA